MCVCVCVRVCVQKVLDRAGYHRVCVCVCQAAGADAVVGAARAARALLHAVGEVGDEEAGDHGETSPSRVAIPKWSLGKVVGVLSERPFVRVSRRIPQDSLRRLSHRPSRGGAAPCSPTASSSTSRPRGARSFTDHTSLVRLVSFVRFGARLFFLLLKKTCLSSAGASAQRGTRGWRRCCARRERESAARRR